MNVILVIEYGKLRRKRHKGRNLLLNLVVQDSKQSVYSTISSLLQF